MTVIHNKTRTTALSQAERAREVERLADAIRAVCGDNDINVVGPALTLAMYAAMKDTGGNVENLKLVAEELSRRLVSMLERGEQVSN